MSWLGIIVYIKNMKEKELQDHLVIFIIIIVLLLLLVAVIIMVFIVCLNTLLGTCLQGNLCTYPWLSVELGSVRGKKLILSLKNNNNIISSTFHNSQQFS